MGEKTIVPFYASYIMNITTLQSWRLICSQAHLPSGYSRSLTLSFTCFSYPNTGFFAFLSWFHSCCIELFPSSECPPQTDLLLRWTHFYISTLLKRTSFGHFSNSCAIHRRGRSWSHYLYSACWSHYLYSVCWSHYLYSVCWSCRRGIFLGQCLRRILGRIYIVTIVSDSYRYWCSRMKGEG